jgi:hypothetical protein
MKNKNVRALLVDPFAEKVTEVKIGTDLQELYSTLGCELITITRLGVGKDALDMILDDEGLLKDPSNQRYFKYKLFSQPFAGRALLVTSDKQGNTTSVPDHILPYHIEKDIIWYKPQQQELEESLEFKITTF